ncbi:hypothetical protein AHAS_Ahas01G0174600 [Arachis hypogaea]
MPNGSQAIAQFIEIVKFLKSLILTNILYLSQFHFNLISISKLTSSISKPCRLSH